MEIRKRDLLRPPIGSLEVNERIAVSWQIELWAPLVVTLYKLSYLAVSIAPSASGPMD